MPSSVKLGSRPRMSLMRWYSSGVRPCLAMSSGVTAGAGMGGREIEGLLVFEGAVSGSGLVKPNFGAGKFRRRLKQRQQLLINIAQGGVVLKQGFVDFGQSFRDGRVGGQYLALLDKGADNVDAHRDRPGTVQDIRSHHGAMLGEDVREILEVMAFLQGRNLRP